MKNWILWSFSRGSVQYDVFCALILIAIFAIPQDFFNDRPPYMRVSGADEVTRSLDSDENVVFTVKVSRTLQAAVSPAERQTQALEVLNVYLGGDQPAETFRVRPIYDTKGMLLAFAFWVK